MRKHIKVTPPERGQWAGVSVGRMTVLRRDLPDHPSRWICRCACGHEWSVSMTNIAKTTQCLGCKVHYHKAPWTRLEQQRWKYHIKAFENRGITVVPSWMRGPVQFCHDTRDILPHSTLTPLNPRQPIGPHNLRVSAPHATRGCQITYRGITKHMADWGRVFGVTRERIRQICLRDGNLDKWATRRTLTDKSC